MDKLIRISIMKMVIKAIFNPSMTLSDDFSTKIIRKSSMKSEQTVSSVMNIWNNMLRIDMNVLFDYLLEDADFLTFLHDLFALVYTESEEFECSHPIVGEILFVFPVRPIRRGDQVCWRVGHDRHPSQILYNSKN